VVVYKRKCLAIDVLSKDATILSILKGVFQCTLVPKTRQRAKWARFVRTHRANFTPQRRFMVSSEHFGQECFERSLHVEGSQRTLRPGSVPTIWMKQKSQEPCSLRSVQSRKKVSTCFLLQ